VLRVSRVSTCPDCGSPIPVDPWPSWCEGCSWGIVAPSRTQPTTAREALYDRVGAHVGDRALTRLESAEQLRPRLTPSRAVAIVIALCVHLLTLAFVLAAVLLVVRAWQNPFADVLAAMLLVTAWLMRPRFGETPEGTPVERDASPALRVLLDEVAAVLSEPAPEIVVITHEWNASFGVVGPRRRHALTVGLPLLTALSPQERVALVAHELAHGRHGDSSRGLLVGTAVNGLVELYRLMLPSEGIFISRWGVPTRGATAWDSLHKAVFWLVSRPVYWLLLLEAHLLLQDMRRAEYLADVVAAEVAGTDAAVALSETILLGPAFAAIVSRNVHAARSGDTSIFAELDAAVAAVTPRERERRRRIARLERSRLGDTHPPTALRIRLLEQRPRLEPSVTLTAERSAAIDDELARYRKPVADRVVDDARDRLYA
jgi:Zn-dependent protease with chaperone function